VQRINHAKARRPTAAWPRSRTGAPAPPSCGAG